MKKRVVAEGVETLEQLEFLQQLNCDDMQGYFVSKPVNAEEFEMLLRTHTRWDRFSRLKAA
jgi:EAL domain-containing protein (putative c-di-GMP-specific phosphodiesterase class I)